MTRPAAIELGEGGARTRIPVLYEDRSVLAIDKPAGLMLAPFSWQRTQRNLLPALLSSIAAGDFWARSRGLKFLRNVHRLDAETTGILLFVRSLGAVEPYSELFESRRMRKTYLAVVAGAPATAEWVARAPLGPDPRRHGLMRVDERAGKEAETAFRVLEAIGGRTLVEAHPVTGRTHQIRVHLQAAGHPVLGDTLYGPAGSAPEGADPARFPLGLRATELSYRDPFLRRPIRIRAPEVEFRRAFGFGPGPGSDGHRAAKADP